MYVRDYMYQHIPSLGPTSKTSLTINRKKNKSGAKSNRMSNW
jgi:hypothetical protein